MKIDEIAIVVLVAGLLSTLVPFFCSTVFGVPLMEAKIQFIVVLVCLIYLRQGIYHESATHD